MCRGFTLIELIIVVAILALIVGIILPCVQKVRDSAARMSCTNNLKEFGLAIHNYHDAYDHFPPGTMPNPALSPEQRLSFHVAIYPFVESSNVYKRLAKEEPWDAPTNVSVLADFTPRLFFCPAWYREQAPLTGHLAITNYVGVAGVGADAATRAADAPGIGIFGYDRTITMKDVKDGMWNTAMLMETGIEVGPWVRGGPSTVRGVDVDDLKFGSTHSRQRMGSFNVLLADGSVRFTQPDIDPTVLAALATVAGREEIPADW